MVDPLPKRIERPRRQGDGQQRGPSSNGCQRCSERLGNEAVTHPGDWRDIGPWLAARKKAPPVGGTCCRFQL
jgi:hypothetical protein